MRHIFINSSVTDIHLMYTTYVFNVYNLMSLEINVDPQSHLHNLCQKHINDL